MADVVLAVMIYEGLVLLAFVLCWRLVRRVDTRLPIEGSVQAMPGDVAMPTLRGLQRSPALLWQGLALLLGAAVLCGVAFAGLQALGGLRDLAMAEVAGEGSRDLALRLALPVGHLVLVLGLYLFLRRSVLFPAIMVHLLLIVFCLAVSLIDITRIDPNRLTLTPIFAANLVLLIATHGLLTLLFCQSRSELLAAVVLAAIAGGILAIGTVMIALVSTLFGGPLFFVQLYLISAFGIFGLYFCASSLVLARWARD